MERKIVCIVCHKGCQMTAVSGDGQDATAWTVSGNACARGRAYALAECTDPQRTVTSIMRVQNREDTMVSCKTQTTVPKDSMPEVVRLIRSTCAYAPVRIGDVLCQTPAGVSIIATKNID